MSAAVGLPSRERKSTRLLREFGDRFLGGLMQRIALIKHRQLSCFSSLRTRIPGSQFLIGVGLDVRG
jgi:hypothetical protein